MGIYLYSDELQHHGIKGMKWGIRKDRKNAKGRSSWSKDASLKKRDINKLSNDELRKLNERTRLEQEYRQLNPSAIQKGLKFAGNAAKKGAQVGVAVGKASIKVVKKGAEVAKNLLQKYRNAKVKKQMSEDAANVEALKKKNPKQLSNAELKKLNERSQLEQQYKNLNPSAAKKGLKFVASTAAVMGTALTLYNNSGALIKAGKSVGGKIIDVAGDLVMKDLARGLRK